MAKSDSKEDMKMDTAQDKAMIKKAFKQHDAQEHKGGKGTFLKLYKGGETMANTSRMNRLEELGRVDSERATTAKGKRNLAEEKQRIVGEMKYAKGGSVKASSMGAVRTAAPSRDGIASKGKTKGAQVKMAGSGVPKGIGIKTMAKAKR